MRGSPNHGDVDSSGASGQQDVAAPTRACLTRHDIVDQKQSSTFWNGGGARAVKCGCDRSAGAPPASGSASVPMRMSAKKLRVYGPEGGQPVGKHLSQKMRGIKSSSSRRETASRDGYDTVDRTDTGGEFPCEAARHRSTCISLAAEFPSPQCLGPSFAR